MVASTELSEWESEEYVTAFRERLSLTVDEKKENGGNPDDATVRRFLRARKGDVSAAVEQYIGAERFFQERGCPTLILTNPDPAEACYNAYCPARNFGFDKEGRPVYIEKTGLVNVPTLTKVRTPYDLVHRHVRQQEIAAYRMRQSSKERGTVVENQIIIYDLKGLPLRPDATSMSLMKAVLTVSQDYYPERLFRFYLINAPFVFMPVWAVIKVWLDPKTADKFRVLGRNFQDELLQQIDADQLPVDMGGTAESVWRNTIPLTEDQLKVFQERVEAAKKADRLWKPNPEPDQIPAGDEDVEPEFSLSN
mmetsp:Transcript_23385/g.34902  ORF Transcript_23385/g.34902 Transcript_23385/m.34902 type:complete len:308 (-) Transcript_23385:171-1094(-)